MQKVRVKTVITRITLKVKLHALNALNVRYSPDGWTSPASYAEALQASQRRELHADLGGELCACLIFNEYKAKGSVLIVTVGYCYESTELFLQLGLKGKLMALGFNLRLHKFNARGFHKEMTTIITTCRRL